MAILTLNAIVMEFLCKYQKQYKEYIYCFCKYLIYLIQDLQAEVY